MDFVFFIQAFIKVEDILMVTLAYIAIFTIAHVDNDVTRYGEFFYDRFYVNFDYYASWK